MVDDTRIKDDIDAKLLDYKSVLTKVYDYFDLYLFIDWDNVEFYLYYFLTVEDIEILIVSLKKLLTPKSQNIDILKMFNFETLITDYTIDHSLHFNYRRPLLEKIIDHLIVNFRKTDQVTDLAEKLLSLCKSVIEKRKTNATNNYNHSGSHMENLFKYVNMNFDNLDNEYYTSNILKKCINEIVQKNHTYTDMEFKALIFIEVYIMYYLNIHVNDLNALLTNVGENNKFMLKKTKLDMIKDGISEKFSKLLLDAKISFDTLGSLNKEKHESAEITIDYIDDESDDESYKREIAKWSKYISKRMNEFDISIKESGLGYGLETLRSANIPIDPTVTIDKNISYCTDKDYRVVFNMLFNFNLFDVLNKFFANTKNGRCIKNVYNNYIGGYTKGTKKVYNDYIREYTADLEKYFKDTIDGYKEKLFPITFNNLSKLSIYDLCTLLRVISDIFGLIKEQDQYNNEHNYKNNNMYKTYRSPDDRIHNTNMYIDNERRIIRGKHSNHRGKNIHNTLINEQSEYF